MKKLILFCTIVGVYYPHASIYAQNVAYPLDNGLDRRQVIERFIQGCELGVLENIDYEQLNTLKEGARHILTEFGFSSDDCAYIRTLCMACKVVIQSNVLGRSAEDFEALNTMLQVFLYDLQECIQERQKEGQFDFESLFIQLADGVKVFEDESSLETNAALAIACINEVISAIDSINCH